MTEKRFYVKIKEKTWEDISMSIEKQVFGTTKNGETVHAYTITSESGISVTLLEFGATVNKLFDKNGNAVDVVCGYDKLSDYENADGYQGAVVGRFGNRIGKGKFTLDGVEYQTTVLDSACLTQTVTAPPMAEELVYENGRVTIMCESACMKYLFGKFTSGNWAYSVPIA